MNFASVQTTADSAPLSMTQVLVAVAALFILALLVSLPQLIEAWKAAHNVVDLDRERAKRRRHPSTATPIRSEVRKGGWGA